MNSQKTTIVLIVAIMVAIATRFFKLGEAPAGLYLDEAAQGYNAYSILNTGKDEFGKSFPIVFRSFTDFKTPVYIYLVAPLIPIFDLTKFTVRFPSFLFSILTIPILYLLIVELGAEKFPKSKSKILAVVSCFLLSISPWHILFGRTNFECNVALFFFLSGVLTFYKSLKRPKLLIVSSLLFAIAIPAYHAQRVVTPLILLLLFLRHKNILLSKTHIKLFLAGAVLGTIIILPTLSVATTPGFLARAGLNIFNFEKQKPAGYIDTCNEGVACKIINNRVYLHTKEFIALYISYFSPRNMFYLGDYGQRSSFPNLSTYFLWEFPFYIIGIYYFTKKTKSGELRFFTLAMLFVSPLPAAVTRDPYTTIRALQMVIPQTLITAYGIIYLIGITNKVSNSYCLKKLFNPTITVLAMTVIFYSLTKLYSSVIILNEYYRAPEWNRGFDEVSRRIKGFDPQIPVVVDNARTEPYSQFLFFLKADPATYQKQNYEVPLSEYYTNMNRNTTKHINQIVTRPIEWKTDLMVNQYLIGDQYAISPEQISENELELVDEIKYPDGVVAFRIVKTNPDYQKTIRGANK